MKKKGYTIKDETELEDLFENQTADNYLEGLRKENITRYRTKTIKSGNMLEIEIYPHWNTRQAFRGKKQKVSRAAQKNLNNKNATKKAIRLINANFTDEDIWATFTYSVANEPSSVDDAIKKMHLYIKKLRYHARKLNYPELKYVYVTEFNKEKKVRIHHHVVMNFKDRDLAEKLWKGGNRTQTRRLQKDEFDYEGLARYITKGIESENNQEKKKKFIVSRNLKQPKVTISDFAVTRKKAHMLATGQTSDVGFFEKRYSKYKFNQMEVKTSDYVSGAYLYVKMRLRI